MRAGAARRRVRARRDGSRRGAYDEHPCRRGRHRLPARRTEQAPPPRRADPARLGVAPDGTRPQNPALEAGPVATVSRQAAPVNDTRGRTSASAASPRSACSPGFCASQARSPPWLTGANQPVGNLGAVLDVLAHPARPALALRAPGLSPFAYWVVRRWSADRGRAGRVARPAARALAALRRRSSAAGRACQCGGDRESRVGPGVAGPGGDLAPVPAQARCVSGGVPVGAGEGQSGVGQRGGLDAPDRPAAIREGAAYRHQRDPRGSRLGRDDFDPPGQPDGNAHRPPAASGRSPCSTRNVSRQGCRPGFAGRRCGAVRTR